MRANQCATAERLPARWHAAVLHCAALLGLILCNLGVTLYAPAAEAAFRTPFTARFSTNANGDIAHIGNNLLTCNTADGNTGNGNSCPTTQAGTSGSALTTYGHNGQTISTNINVDPNAAALGLFNSSSADLNMPAGSTVLWAGLYWGASTNNAGRNQVLFRSPALSGYTGLTATQLDDNGDPYAGFIDVTSMVQTAGNGTYWMANVQTNAGVLNGGHWGGWALVVVFTNNALPLRNMVVYDGYSLVTGTGANGVIIPVSGFLTPLSGTVTTRVGSIGYDGDRSDGVFVGDNLQVVSPASSSAPGTTIFDANNPSNNFYNSTISDLGVMVTSRNPAHNNTYGFDIDRFNLAPGVIANGATSARLEFVTNGEFYYPHVITWTTDIYVPIITPNVVKTLSDVNGGSLVPGDTMRWTISMSNTGVDSGTFLTVKDTIPANTTYVPGSLRVLTTPAADTHGAAGPAVGAYSDAANTAGGAAPTNADDVADYSTVPATCAPAAAPCVIFRLGHGANSTLGGILGFGDATSISFDTLLNDGLSGRPAAPPGGTLITNSAFIQYSGQTIQSQFDTTSSAATGNSASPPQIAKSFTPSAIATGGTSVLSIVVSNPASNPDTLSGVVVADTYPAGMINATPFDGVVVCTALSSSSAINTAVHGAGGNTIGINPGATLAPGGSCTITVTVTHNGSVTGPTNLTNITNPVTSTNGGVGGTAQAVLGVAQLGIVKSFLTGAIQASFNTPAANVPPSGTTGIATPVTSAITVSTMSIAITNPNGASVSQVTFSDSYPAGLLNGATPVVGFSNCGAATNVPPINVITTAATSGVNVTAANAVTIASGATCVITLRVGSTVTSGAQIYNNQTSGARYSGNTLAGNPSNVAQLTVVGPATVAKSFNPVSVAPGGLSRMTIVVTNPNTTTTLVGNATTLTDTYPAGATGMSTPAGTGNRTINCTPGSSATASNSVTVVTAGAMVLAPGGSCTLAITVTAGATAGSNPNNVAGVLWTNAPPSQGNATLNITNIVSPTFGKFFTPSTVAVGTLTTMSFVVTASANVTGPTGVSFSDALPGGLVMTLPATTISGSCTSGGFNGVTSSASVTAFAVTGLSVPGSSGSCTITIPGVMVTTVGSHLNTTSQLITSNAGTAAAATATAIGVVPPVIAKSFTPGAVASTSASVLSITVSNPVFNAATLTGVVFTDSYPANLVNSATPSAIASCTPGSSLVGSLTAAANGTQVAVTGAGLTLAVDGQCVITVNVRSSIAGNYTNTIDTGAGVGAAGVRVTSTNGGTGNATSAALAVDLISVSKAFAPATIGIGGTSLVTLTLSNPQSIAVTPISFTDTFPAGMTLTSPVVGGTCGATTSPLAAAGASSISVNGGTVPANGTCTVTFSVTSSASGGNPNTSGGVTGGGGTGSPSNTAVLQVLPAPSVGKSFAPSVVGQGGVSTMTVTILNTSTGAASAGALVDSYPAGMVNANPSNITTSCNGTPLSAVPTLTATAGSGSFSATNLYFPGNGSCVITVRVTAASAGAYVNTIAAGALTSTGGANSAPASATLTVLLPPTVSKVFTPSAVAASGSSTLIITLTNPNTTAITGAAFTDTYPVVAGIYTNSTPANGATTCAGGIVTAANGGTSVGLTGGTIAAGSSCTVSVNVTATATTGSFNNTITAGAVTTANAGSNALAATSALAVGRPFVSKVFNPSPVLPQTTTTLTFSITNPNNASINTVGLVDNLPALPSQMQVATSGTGVGTTSVCGGTNNLSAPANGNTITLTGGVIAANSTCVFSVLVRAGAVSGTAVNATNPVTSSVGNGSVATASINVMAAPTASKSFSPATVGAGTPSVLTITLTNPNSSPITGGAFTDAYPFVNAIQMTNTATPAGTTSCSGGSVIAANGGTSLALTGATIPASGSCVVTVNVQAATAGAFVNFTGPVTSANATAGASVSGTLTVLQPLRVTKSFSPVTVTRGAPSVMTISLQNLNATAVTGVALTDTYPSGMINTAAPAAAIGGAGCAAAGTISGVANDNALSYSGTVPASTTCTLTVNTTANVDGVFLNSTGVTATGNAGSSAATSGTLVVSGQTPGTNLPVVVTKVFNPSTIAQGGVSTLSISVFNPNSGTAVTSAATVFTDTYPSGVVNTSVATFGAVIGLGCTAPVRTAPLGGTSFLVAGVSTANPFSIPAGGTCTYEIRVTAPVAGVYTNSTGNLTFATPGTNATPGGAQLTVLAPPVISKSFTPSTVAGALTATSMSVTITNPNPTPITGVNLTDTYPAVTLRNTALPDLINTCTGVASAGALASALTLTGGTIPALGSCTLTVNVESTASPINHNNTIATGSVTTTNTGNPIAPASATLTVGAAVPPVSIVKRFTPASVVAGANSQMQIVFTKNAPTATVVSAIQVTDTFPAGMVVATIPTAGAWIGSCNGATFAAIRNPGNTATVAINDTGFRLTASGTLPNFINGDLATATCTLTLNVRSATAGTFVNATTAVTSSTTGTGNSASATLTVTASPRPIISKAFSPASVTIGQLSTLTFTLQNPDTNALTALAFSDTMPAGITVDSPNGLVNNCGGTALATAGTSVISLAAGILGPGSVATPEVCTISVNVQASSAANFNNVTNTVSANNGGAVTGNFATAPLTVSPLAPSAVEIAKAFLPSTITAGGVASMSFTLSNLNTSIASSGTNVVMFSDPLTNMRVTTSGTVVNGCANTNLQYLDGTGTWSSTQGGAIGVRLRGNGATGPGTVVPARVGGVPGTCTVAFQVTSDTPGVFPNATTGVTANVGPTVTGSPSNVANLTVTAAAPSIVKSFLTPSVPIGGVSRMRFVITNPNNAVLTGLSFTDGLTNIELAGVPNVGGTCTGVSTTASGGAVSFTVTSGTLPASGSCTVEVDVVGTTVSTGLGWPNIASGVTTTQTPVAGSQSNVAYLQVTGTGVALSGTVYFDANDNGVRDIGTTPESWASGVPLFVNLVTGGVVVQSIALTAGSGDYSFTNVTPGVYTIVITNSAINAAVVAPTGWFFRSPVSGSLSATVALVATSNWNFGLRAGALISGKVFRDTGGGAAIANNGVLDAGEVPVNPQSPLAAQGQGIAGVTMRLTDCGSPGTVYATTTTDVNGDYRFATPGVLPANLCVVETNSTGFVSTGGSVGSTQLISDAPGPGPTNYLYCRTASGVNCSARPAPADSIAFTPVAGTSYQNLNFGNVPSNQFVANGSKQSPPATTVFYPHIFTPGSVGSVTFTPAAVASPSMSGWGEVIYRDNNCDGALNAAESALPIGGTASAGATVLADPNDVTAGDPNGRRICIIMRQSIPPSAPFGAQNVVTVTANFTYTNSLPLLATTLTVVDTTLSGSATGGDGLRLVKEVCNVSNPAVNPGGLACVASSGAGFGTDNIGAPGNELQYRIVYTNVSSNPLGTLIINDSTPPFTVRAAGAAYVTTPGGAGGLTNGTLTQPTLSGSGAFAWPFGGFLLPGASGIVSFNVTIQ